MTNEIYHVFNRGVEKRSVFLNERDYKHFLETIEHYCSTNTKLSRKAKSTIRPLQQRQLVEILGYCLMPNHFHLLLRQIGENGISIFLGRIENSFTKYFNIKNERVGPLFQGAFKAVLVENDEHFLHLSRYIHLNPLVGNLVKDLKKYRWSSFPAYLGEEKNGFLSTQEILSHFSSSKDYEKFIMDHAEYAKSLEAIKHQLFD